MAHWFHNMETTFEFEYHGQRAMDEPLLFSSSRFGLLLLLLLRCLLSLIMVSFQRLCQRIRALGCKTVLEPPVLSSSSEEQIMVDGGPLEFEALFDTQRKPILLGQGQFGTVTEIHARPGVSIVPTMNQPLEPNQKENASPNNNVVHELDDEETHSTIANSVEQDRFLHVETPMVGQQQEQSGSHTNTMTPRRFACKRLAKGVVFQNNVLYAPLSRTQIQTEITCLRVLQGRHQCLGLHRVFETRTEILLVTDLCPQGHLLQFLKRYSSGSGGGSTIHAPSNRCSETSLILPVSMLLALAHQLLDAIRHCAKHGIIHRDIKPQNCLISSSSSPQDHQPPPVDYPVILTLADFGSSALHPPTHSSSTTTQQPQPQQVDLPFHSTFVGSSLYRSPEMSHRPRCYNQKTDVWSAGVVLSVAAMGYPHTHDVLRASSSGKNHPPPVSPFRDQARFSGLLLGDVVNACLTRDMEQRPNAQEILDTYQVWPWQDKQQQQQQDERTTEP